MEGKESIASFFMFLFSVDVEIHYFSFNLVHPAGKLNLTRRDSQSSWQSAIIDSFAAAAVSL